MKQELEQLFADVIKNVFDIETKVVLTRPEPKFGDFATNIALQLVKQVGDNPRTIAQKICDGLKHDAIAETSIAGPGFINMSLSSSAVNTLLRSEPKKLLKGKTVVAEYSDPNPFKVLHAGHLYTSLVGDAISRLLDAAGANVKRVNFGGDVGLHVGKAMWAIIKKLEGENPDALNSVDSNTRAQWVSQRYVEGNTAYETSEEAKQEIVACNKRVYELHQQGDKDSAFAKIYWTCRQWSYDGFEELYEKLGMVPFDKYYPESVTTQPGIDSVNQGLEQSVFTKSNDAVVYEGDESKGLHTRVFITSEGLPTYETKDLGLAKSKWLDFKFDQNIIITGNDIIDYMRVVLDVLGNFYPEIASRTTHLTHGMIKLSGGAKMSSRKGNVLLASDVIGSATTAANTASENNDDYVVIGAIRYAFFKQSIGGDIIYDPQESVSLHGNSGPYLQYAHARASSIISNKQRIDESSLESIVFEAEESLMVRKLSEFAETVEHAIAELAPHHLCNYLYELTQEFNRYYEKNRVLGSDKEEMRLALVQCYRRRLGEGLRLLGIHAPDKM